MEQDVSELLNVVFYHRISPSWAQDSADFTSNLNFTSNFHSLFCKMYRTDSSAGSPHSHIPSEEHSFGLLVMRNV